MNDYEEKKRETALMEKFQHTWQIQGVDAQVLLNQISSASFFFFLNIV